MFELLYFKILLIINDQILMLCITIVIHLKEVSHWSLLFTVNNYILTHIGFQILLSPTLSDKHCNYG